MVRIGPFLEEDCEACLISDLLLPADVRQSVTQGQSTCSSEQWPGARAIASVAGDFWAGLKHSAPTTSAWADPADVSLEGTSSCQGKRVNTRETLPRAFSPLQ